MTLTRNLTLFEDRKGEYQQWEEPLPETEYIIGADIALGRSPGGKKNGATGAGDYSTFCVVKRNQFTLEQVAEGRTRCEAAHFGEIISAWGALYNHAVINMERNLADAPHYALRKSGYPMHRLYQPPQSASVSGLYSAQYYFQKTSKNSKYLVDTTVEYLERGSVIIRSSALLTELRALQKDEQNRVVTRSMDLSVALMMAVIVDATTDPPPPPPEARNTNESPPQGVDVTLWMEMHGIKKPSEGGDGAPDWGGGGDGPPDWSDVSVE